MSDHNQSSSSSSGKDHSFEFLALPYDEFDVLVSDINEQELEKFGRLYEVEHLSAGSFSSPPSQSKWAEKPNKCNVNVWFLVDTGSPFTCLTKKSLKSIFGAEKEIHEDDYYMIAIQDQKSKIECRISKAHFQEVNILGADAMRKLKLSIDVDWEADEFKLIKKP